MKKIFSENKKIIGIGIVCLAFLIISSVCIYYVTQYNNLKNSETQVTPNTDKSNNNIVNEALTEEITALKKQIEAYKNNKEAQVIDFTEKFLKTFIQKEYTSDTAVNAYKLSLEKVRGMVSDDVYTALLPPEGEDIISGADTEFTVDKKDLSYTSIFLSDITSFYKYQDEKNALVYTFANMNIEYNGQKSTSLYLYKNVLTYDTENDLWIITDYQNSPVKIENGNAFLHN